jgi:hypothetical protein
MDTIHPMGELKSEKQVSGTLYGVAIRDPR